MAKPTIRFRGFDDEWEQCKFGSLLEEKRNKTTVENEDILLSCAIDGMYLNSELFSHFRGSSNIGYLKVKKNDLILSAQNLHLGNCNVNLRFEHGIISPAYKVYKLVECNPMFMQAWVKKERTKDFFLKASTEGASVCRKNIVWEELYKQELPVPRIEEQTKVGDYFSNLDHLINLHQCKCDETKKLKKYMLQKMFPQNGKKIPEIRFEGFTDEWEQRKLGEVCDFINGDRSSNYPNDTDFYDSGIPFVGSDSLGDTFVNRNKLRFISCEKYEQMRGLKIQNKDILYTLRGAGFGKCSISDFFDGTVASSLVGIRCNEEELEPYFFVQWLNSTNAENEKKKAVNGSTAQNISVEDMKKYMIYLPLQEEQQKIGAYFCNLDYLITLHQRKCEELKKLKKFMLQNMFPQEK